MQAYYRRAAARFLLGRHAEALRDYKQASLCRCERPPRSPLCAPQVLKLRPSDKDASAKVKECEKVVAALRFAGALRHRACRLALTALPAAIANPDEDEVSRPAIHSCLGSPPHAAACALASARRSA